MMKLVFYPMFFRLRGMGSTRAGCWGCQRPRSTVGVATIPCRPPWPLTLGNGCEDGGLVFSVAVHVVSCVVPIWRHGSEAQKRRYLPDLCRGALVGLMR